jgi:hypothetical protein
MIPGNPRSVADRPRERQPERPACVACWLVSAAVLWCVVAGLVWLVFVVVRP